MASVGNRFSKEPSGMESENGKLMMDRLQQGTLGKSKLGNARLRPGIGNPGICGKCISGNPIAIQLMIW